MSEALPGDCGPFLPGVTPIPGGWTERSIAVGNRSYRLIVPGAPDAFLDDPTVRDRNLLDDYMPYWASLWPPAVPMAESLLRASWTVGTPALEIGCGLGLVGLAALDAGLDVVFSDYDAGAVEVALANARRNGHPDARGMVIDWRNPPAQTFPVILGCDVVYDPRNHALILSLLERMLEPAGTALIGDGGRQHASAFLRDARKRGFAVAIEDEEGLPLGEPRHGRFQLFRMTLG